MRALLSFVMLAALLWSSALVWFVQTMPRAQVDPSIQTDAIVVLTGGADRVERGFSMLAAGAAPVLLISGVGEKVTLADMLRQHASPAAREAMAEHVPEVVLDYVANSTQTNADQTAAFARARHIASLRLITAHYHMKRSVLEFHAAMPGVTIVADPVFPQGFRRDQWWQHDTSRRLVFSEFNKYWAVLLRGAL